MPNLFWIWKTMLGIILLGIQMKYFSYNKIFSKYIRIRKRLGSRNKDFRNCLLEMESKDLEYIKNNYTTNIVVNIFKWLNSSRNNLTVDKNCHKTVNLKTSQNFENHLVLPLSFRQLWGLISRLSCHNHNDTVMIAAQNTTCMLLRS